MKIIKTIFFSFFAVFITAQSEISPLEIIEKIDANMVSENRIVESKMIVYGNRRDRTVESKSYSRGSNDSYTEYTAPSREKGTKMLKLEDQLWIFSPQSERTIKISGHLLKQSVMGSDLSYEDMMEQRELVDIYDVKLVGNEVIDGRDCYVLELNAIVEDVTYVKRKMWVDSERFVPLKEDLFAKSGTLLKQVTLSDVQQIQGRWYPMKINYRDVLRSGKGTDYEIVSLKLDVDIPEYLFTKSVLIN
jgi:outer membrane lipoprotein-sorting protein